MKNCDYCHSANILTDIAVDQDTTAPGKIGLKYHTKFIIDGIEPLYADLCKDCGSITRLYIKKTDRNWCSK